MAARIALLDIETAPSRGWVWGKYDVNVIEMDQDWYILSIAWKWLGEDNVSVRALPDYDGYDPTRHDDRDLVGDLWRVLDEADIVVAHNGDGFDIKKSNARFLIHNLPQPSPYKTFDTLKILKKHFRFDGNGLQDICTILGIGQKLPHQGFSLWKGCMRGDMACWEQMKAYNAHDVVMLEPVYLRLRSWGNHPDVTLYEKDGVVVAHSCPSCGSSHTHRRGTAIARTRKYQRFSCQDCGKWFQGSLEK